MSRGTIEGLGVSAGIAIGRPLVRDGRGASVVKVHVPVGQRADEVERFRRALSRTIDRIGATRDRAADQMGEEYASIFDAHKLIAADPSLSDEVIRQIIDVGVNAEWALDQVISRVVSELEEITDVYLSERRLDVLDVGTQILETLKGQEEIRFTGIHEPVIVVADDLPPSLAVQLPLDRILGFVLEQGGPTSHTSIIARSFGIPTVIGAHGACNAATNAERLIVDAFEGHVIVDPDPAETREYRSRQEAHAEQIRLLEPLRYVPNETSDGLRIQLMANIDLPVEVEQAMSWGVDGIGLYRSEFLYMKMSPMLPSEMDHVAFYRLMITQMEGRPVTIRTFDLGGKKLSREVIGSLEANPVLGMRGIRLCLRKLDFFRVQLRALLRAAGEVEVGRVRIMIPLVSGIEEIRRTKFILAQERQALLDEGVYVHDEVPFGAMIEVPSAAVLADALCKEVDFVSIGTNDLIQYTLAIDRANELVADMYRPTHPAILQLVENVIEAGARHGVDVSMCGEMAAEPLLVPVLIGLGMRKLSVNPQAVPVVRNLIRQLTLPEAQRIAAAARDLVTATEVEEFLLEQLAILLAKIKIEV